MVPLSDKIKSNTIIPSLKVSPHKEPIKKPKLRINEKQRAEAGAANLNSSMIGRGGQDKERPSVVESHSVITRQGFIPGYKKQNQDAFIVEKDFAGIQNLWLMGVCDGHGAQGHLVSSFVKQNLPRFLSDQINK